MFAIIAAAGKSSRFGFEKKQFLKIKEKYILEISIEKFLACNISQIVVATEKQDIPFAKKILEKFKNNVSFIEGKETRQKTVENAFLAHYKNQDKDDIVLIHDAARPFFEIKKVKQLIKTAKKTKAAILAAPIFDTVKLFKNNEIEKTIKRENLLLSQTPQAFSIELYKTAIENAYKKNITCTDDCQLVENLNQKISVILSSKTNFKITTKEDLDYIYLLSKKEKKPSLQP